MKKLTSLLVTGCDISIEYNSATNRKIVVSDPNDQFGAKDKEMFVFSRDDSISGKIKIKPQGKKIEHQGIKVELIGEIVLYYESKEVHQFIYLTKDLDAPGILTSDEHVRDFEFMKVDKPYESYRGINADLRYYVRVTVARSIGKLVQEEEFWVQNLGEKPEKDKGVIMEVGIENVIMLQIKYERVNLDLGGIVQGKLNFSLVNADIDIGEVSIIKKETIGYAGSQHTEQETLKKFEVIDGSPISGEVVPMRIYLNSIEKWKLTPTCENVNNKFTVKYFLHLSLCDKAGRRYFKQHELFLWRKTL